MSVVVTTYNAPLLLRRVLLAIRRQTVLPGEVVVADDGSTPETGDLLSGLAPQLPFPLVHAWQPDEGFRAARGRNMAIFVAGGDRLAFLDQDVLPHADWLETHLEELRPGRVCLGESLFLPDACMERLGDDAIASGVFQGLHTESETMRLRRLQRRAQFYAFLRCHGVGIKAKPRLKSCNWSAMRADLLAVNGFDEEYVGWGQEDDDLGRRLYASGVRPVCLLDRALVSHMPHPQRAPQAWAEGPNVARYLRGIAAPACARGLRDHPHGDTVIRRHPGGGSVR